MYILKKIINATIEFNHKHNHRLLFILLLIAYLLSTLYMLGYGVQFDRIFFSFILLFFFFDYRVVKFYVALIAIFTALYFPAGLYYGYPGSGIVVAIAETNSREAKEFIKDIPWWLYPASLLYLLLTYRLLKLKYHPIKTMRYALLMLLVLSLVLPMDLPFRAPLLLLELPMHCYLAVRDYQQDKEQLVKQSKIPPSWNIIASQPQYKNYVLVMGESVRRDYMQVYGFPLPDTPFMQRTPGIVWDGLVSPAHSSRESIMRLLSVNRNNKVEINNNVVTLANQAGFDTYWISNQGRVGIHDTAITRIAVYANKQFFTTTGSYNTRKLIPADDVLLKPLQAALAEPTQKPRLFILHIMGSHANFCDRINNNITLRYYNKNLSCYVSSIKQTDLLLSKIYQLLQQTSGESGFSLLYLADHGMGHTWHSFFSKTLRHNEQVKQGYQIPLFITDSNSQQQEKITGLRSGFRFINALAEWMSITPREFKGEDRFFSPGAEAEVRVLSGKLYLELKDDPLPVMK